MSLTKKVNAGRFFPAVRSSVFGGRMEQGQVDGMNIILATWDQVPFDDLRWLGYMMGTAYHETAATMQPIHEFGSEDYFTQMYGPEGRRPTVARSMGNIHAGDGPKYCGRGFVQLTWHDNYMRAMAVVGVDLVNHPDLAMRPDIAAKVMFEGMTRSQIVFEDHTHTGPDFSFTGKVLEDYFNDRNEDWVGARRIINGTDHAAMIAATAQKFYQGLAYAA